MKKYYYKGLISDSVNNELITIDEAIAEYDDDMKNRYSLLVKLAQKKQKTLTVILFNPSEKALSNIKREVSKDEYIDITLNGKKKTFVDGTITNVIKIANKCSDYSEIFILNLFSTINSKPEDILKNPQKYIDKYNNANIQKAIDENNDILIAWGGHSQKGMLEIKNSWLSVFSKADASLKYFSWNDSSDSPTHPSPFNHSKIDDFLRNKNKLESMCVDSSSMKFIKQ